MSPQASRYVMLSSLLSVLSMCMATLKLFGLTDVSWLFVFSPILAPLAGGLAIIAIGVSLCAVGGILSYLAAFLHGLRG